MKLPAFKKTAQITAMIMIISVLLPALALAATGFNTSTLLYKNNTVSGSVYSDTYNPDMHINLYNPLGMMVGTAAITTYSVSGNTYLYNFTGNSVSSETYVRLNAVVMNGGNVAESVYADVANTTYSNNNNGHHGGGGGGGYYGGGVSGSTLTVGADGYIDASTLINLLNSNDVVELNLSGDIALIPAKALVDFTSNRSKSLRIFNTKGTYILPLYVLNLSDLAGKLSTTTDDLTIKVAIAAASDANNSDITSSASALGATTAANAVDFMLAGLAPGGETQAVDLGNNYISRIIPLTKTVDPSQATAVVFDLTTKKLSFVPSLFSSTSDGVSEVTIKRNSNSIYTVVELDKNFADVQGHWAQSYIDLLANKMVVDGATDTAFQPERNITRAEFAALVVRALGLDQSVGSNSFKDVTAGDWFSGVVSAATYAKIIDGYEDNTFRPDQPIKREELAAMVVRALNYAGASTNVSSSSQSLAKFTDANKIVWAQQEMAQAVDAGIVDGMTDTTIGPDLQATRAQSATMLKRLLTKANFINN